MSDKRGENSSSGERTAISSKKLLGDLTHKKIKYFLSKNQVSEKELYAVFKNFFKELLEIKKEYTCTELLKELDTVFLQNNTRAQITGFVNKISVVEFKDNAFKEEETRNLFQELDNIVTTIIKFSGKPEEKGFFASLFGIFKKEKEEVFMVEPKQNTNKNASPIEKLENMTRMGKEKKAKKIDESIVEKVPEDTKELEDSGLNDLDQQLEVQDLSETKTKKVDEEQLKMKEELSEEPLHKVKYELPPDDWTEPVKEKKSAKKTSLSDLEESLDFGEPQGLNDKIKLNKKKWKKTKEENIPPAIEDVPAPPMEIKEETPDINKLIKKAKKLKKKDVLEEIYQKIIDLYNAFSDDEQDKYYDDLQLIYDKIQNAKN